MASLYELTGQFNHVAEMLTDEQIEQEVIIHTLESIDAAIEDKADNYAKLIKNQESDSKGIAEEIKRLQTRKQTIDNSVKNLKLSLQDSMVQTGKTKFKTQLFSFNVQNNPPSLEVRDTSVIPKAYFIEQQPTLDKKALKEAVKNGEVIEGVALVQTQSVRIR